MADRVMRLVGRPDLVEQPWFGSAGDRSKNGDLLDEAVAKWIADRPLSEVTEEFERGGAHWRYEIAAALYVFYAFCAARTVPEIGKLAETISAWQEPTILASKPVQRSQ